MGRSFELAPSPLSIDVVVGVSLTNNLVGKITSFTSSLTRHGFKLMANSSSPLKWTEIHVVSTFSRSQVLPGNVALEALPPTTFLEAEPLNKRSQAEPRNEELSSSFSPFSCQNLVLFRGLKLLAQSFEIRAVLNSERE